MNPSHGNLLSVQTIKQRVKELACHLGREDFFIRTEPSGYGSPYIEVLDAYHFVIEERGFELERRITNDLDELLYWIMRGLTTAMAWDYEMQNRREGEDSRRQAFAKDVELLGRLSSHWANLQRQKYTKILGARHFYG
ncbi:MAG: Imm63 family immunity protein [Sphingopyxis sp.]